MPTNRRWERAKSDTRGFRNWRREAVLAIVVAPLSFLALKLWGTNEGAGAVDELVVILVAVAVTLLLAPAAELGWSYARAPFRLLQDDVEALSRSVVELQNREEGRPASLRVALIAVRSELGACATIIVEAQTKREWWRPHDQLPGTKWQEHSIALADPALPKELLAEIDSAYQTCHRMNQRINGYVTEHRASQLISLPIGPPVAVFRFREGDEEALRDALDKIEVANNGISARVDSGQA